jgi:predicted O-methyltransferase YrrM
MKQIKGREPYHAEEALAQCEREAISPEQTLKIFSPGYQIEDQHITLRNHEEEVKRRLASMEGLMGGGANLDLLYGLVSILRPHRLLETGVAYGWSTLALLLATSSQENVKVISVDMPYVKTNHRELVGSAVPGYLRSRWTLIRRPDHEGLPKAIRLLGSVDFAHYDSDKTPEGRMFAYPLIWRSLVPKGLLVSDDVSDNNAFFRFSADVGVTPILVRLEGKFAGILVKPDAGEL